MGRQHYYSERFIAEALEKLRTEYAGFRATARKLGIPDRTLRRWFNKTSHESEKPQRPHYSQEFISEVLEQLYASGMKFRETARRLGVPGSTLRDWHERRSQSRDGPRDHAND